MSEKGKPEGGMRNPIYSDLAHNEARRTNGIKNATDWILQRLTDSQVAGYLGNTFNQTEAAEILKIAKQKVEFAERTARDYLAQGKNMTDLEQVFINNGFSSFAAKKVIEKASAESK